MHQPRSPSLQTLFSCGLALTLTACASDTSQRGTPPPASTTAQADAATPNASEPYPSLRQACEVGDGNACLSYGNKVTFDNQRPLSVSHQLAKEAWLTGCASDHAKSCFELRSLPPKVMPFDEQRIYGRKACELGLNEACVDEARLTLLDRQDSGEPLDDDLIELIAESCHASDPQDCDFLIDRFDAMSESTRERVRTRICAADSAMPDQGYRTRACTDGLTP